MPEFAELWRGAEQSDRVRVVGIAVDVVHLDDFHRKVILRLHLDEPAMIHKHQHRVAGELLRRDLFLELPDASPHRIEPPLSEQGGRD